MQRVTSSILTSLPGPPARPESPDLIRLLGGPRSERAPGTCGCRGTGIRDCPALLSLGTDRAEVVAHADAQLYEADRCPDSGCVYRSLLALVLAGDLLLADLHCSRLSEQPRWSGTGPAAQVIQIVRGRIGLLVGDPGSTRRILGELVQGPIAESLDAVVVGWLTEALVQLGEPYTAENLLTVRGYAGNLPAHLPGKALLLHARGQLNFALRRSNHALKDFLACGAEVAACDFANPAVIPWRSGVALCLRELRQVEPARTLARAELDGARRWGSPREIGRSLLTTALLGEGPDARDLVTEAVDLLAASDARGDVTYAVQVIGSVPGLQRDEVWTRQILRRISDLARRGGNPHAADRAAEALSGFLSLHGEPVLTKHETAVVKLVWAGYSNAEIAGRLSLTRRTVEHHLSAVYRKFRLPDRRHLFLAMTGFL
ncbi:LuxR C-terminal-related transcriptional regulator [Streptomyces sp. BE147]|uniref:helix-turn-helix transcriptional regulator n=1 Tax=Streptomyces sp. BE147 TaxID=3002524 RepID=UPI002E79089C|nr:LuxR C-terminal-related transcriptional regulator [Streptomyces sp. BE147]MEE1735363.1 LuxR C-terminal-related transcriptional regulator [Streptomyces sp. BE147]